MEDQDVKLSELILKSLEGAISREEFVQLDKWLSNPENTQKYIEFMAIHTVLCQPSDYIMSSMASLSMFPIEDDSENILLEAIEHDEKIRSEKAAEEASRQAAVRKAKVEKEAAEAFKEFREKERRRQEKLAYKRYKARQRNLILGITTLAASLFFIVSVWIINYKSSPSVISPPAPTIVASVSDSCGAQWSNPELSTQAGTELSAGPLNLTKGFVEITFGKGAKIILEAPAKIELEDTNHLLLREGRLSAQAPPEAYGFTVDTPNASFVDIGTAFGVNVAENGQSELQVFQGEVVLFAGRNIQAKRTRQTVKAGEAKRVHALNAGISDIPWGKAAYMRHIPSPYELAVRKSKPMAYWDFRQGESKLLIIDRMNQDHDQIQSLGRITLTKGPYLGDGKTGNALQFAGNNSHVYIPKYEDLWEAITHDHTYIFWVRVDEIKSQDIMIETNEGTVQYRHFGITEDGRFVHYANVLKKNLIYEKFSSNLRIQPGQWYHIAITRTTAETDRDGIICLFINGREDISQQVRRTYVSRFSGHFHLGSAPVEGRVTGIGSFEGAIAGIAEYNRALSPDEIKQIYLVTKP